MDRQFGREITVKEDKEFMQDLRAKIFISCGQRKGSDEANIAQCVAQRIKDKGFEPYIAIQQQTLKGLKENIFNELSSSEYFLFIDFRREKISDADSQNDIYRGSLFCHQELAIASFLEIPILGFQEDGVKPDDGILQFVQANSTRFTDRHTLDDVVAGQIDKKEWKPNWKNQLVIDRDPAQFTDAFHAQVQKDARYFHINVRNLNPHKHARNCYAFLEEVYDLSKGNIMPVKTVELKWEGYLLPYVTILPSSYRNIDGFYVFHDHPYIPHFSPFTDASTFVPKIKGAGDYKLTYIVVSDNFEPVKATFKMHLADKLDEVRLDLENAGEFAV